MYLTFNTKMLPSFWFLCSVAVALARAERAGEQQGLATSSNIRMYTNYSESDTHVYMECMPEKTTYHMKPHQRVTVDFIIPTITVTLLVYTCLWGGVRDYMNTTVETITDKWHVETATIPDIGETSGQLQCFMYDVTRLSLVTSICEVHIHIGDGVDDYDPHIRSYGSVQLLMQADNQSTEIPELYIADNTNLTLLCQFNNRFKNPLYNYTMRRIYANGSEVDLVSHYLEDNIYDAINIVAHFQKESYNDNTIVCLQTNIQNNEIDKTKIILKYRNESSETVLTMCLPLICMIIVTGTYYLWVYKSKKIAVSASERNHSDSHIYEDIPLAALSEESAGAAGAAPSGALSRELRSGTPDSNHYEEVYDVMYEDRLRIVWLQKTLQQETNIPKPPPLPPLETIPHRPCNEVMSISPPRRLTPPPSGSLIPASDLYLLKIDSDGYEIPEEMRFIQLSIQQSDGVV